MNRRSLIFRGICALLGLSTARIQADSAVDAALSVCRSAEPLEGFLAYQYFPPVNPHNWPPILKTIDVLPGPDGCPGSNGPVGCAGYYSPVTNPSHWAAFTSKESAP
jgi:hypothetical protein